MTMSHFAGFSIDNYERRIGDGSTKKYGWHDFLIHFHGRQTAGCFLSWSSLSHDTISGHGHRIRKWLRGQLEHGCDGAERHNMAVCLFCELIPGMQPSRLPFTVCNGLQRTPFTCYLGSGLSSTRRLVRHIFLLVVVLHGHGMDGRVVRKPFAIWGCDGFLLGLLDYIDGLRI